MAAKRDLRKQAAATKPKTAAEELIQQSEDEPDKEQKRVLISMLVDADVYADFKELARFRTMQGETNRRGQAMSAASLVNIAMQEFLDRHAEELEQWKTFRSEMLDKFK